MTPAAGSASGAQPGAAGVARGHLTVRCCHFPTEAELPEREESGPPAVLPGRPGAGHPHPRMAAEAGLSAQALKEHREHCPH